MSKTINIFLKTSVSKYPNKISVIKGDTSLSYQEIDNRSELLAKLLKTNGIKKGDRIGVFLGKSPEEVISIFGAVKAGAIFIVLNSKLKREQILHIVKNCQVKGIVTNKARFESALKGNFHKTFVKFLLFMDNEKYTSKRIRTVDKHFPSVPAAQNIACIIYTSGSTGKPKGVMISHKGLIDGAEIVSQYLHCRHNDRVLSLLPFSFDYGLNQLMTTFKNGAPLLLHDFVFPEDVLRTIEKEKITALAGIPTIWISLLNSSLLRHFDYSSLRYITNSGDKIPAEYVKKMIKVFKGTKIYLMYGLTEAFRSTYLSPELIGKKPGSIGKAIPRVKISVLNRKGEECKPGEVGELVHRKALISMGYWGNKKATDKIIRALPEGVKNKKRGEKGLFSGDLVKRDRDGFLYFVGRKDNMIKSSGYRISPTEIEDVLYKIKGITDTIVFGTEDPKLGQKIKAVVCCKGKNNIPRKRIIDSCKNHLPEYAIPHDIIFLDKMFKTNSGKVDRSLIKERYGGYKKD